jgi:hypothetical protein
MTSSGRLTTTERYPLSNRVTLAHMGVFLYDAWVYKLRRQNGQQREHQELANEIRQGLILTAADPDYLRQTAMFLIAFENAFPSQLVEHAIESSARMAVPGMPSVRCERDREHAEAVENPQQRANLWENGSPSIRMIALTVMKFAKNGWTPSVMRGTLTRLKQHFAISPFEYLTRQTCMRLWLRFTFDTKRQAALEP